jgi:two-component system, NarL family, nitrate/nitrite response regulator NarL
MRLVLCDHNRMLGEALAAALERRGHQITAIATSVAAGVAAVAEHLPEVCLLDLQSSGYETDHVALHSIRQRSPETSVVIFCGTHYPVTASEARRLGAAGFLTKDQNVAQIARALDVIASGGAVFDCTTRRHPRAAGRRTPERVYALTPREREVLRRIVAGQSTGQMAKEMNIAISTLRSYVKNLLSKLGTHSRLQAAAVASREGLLAEVSA